MKVKASVADRKSSAFATFEFEFTDFVNLDKQIDDYLDSLPFYKISLELEAIDFEPTIEQSKFLQQIEDGTFKSV